MLLRKPPRKLFDLSLETFAFYVISNIENIEAYFSSLRFESNSSSETSSLSTVSLRDESKNGRTESEASLSTEDKTHHLLHLPSSLYDEILSKILQLLGTMKIFKANKASVSLLLEKLFTVFMTEDLKNLDLNPLKMFLKHYDVHISPMDASAIGCAKNLVSFSLTDMCDDWILYTIAKNCSQLKYLNIAHSRGVSDSGVSALAPTCEVSGCRKLRELIIYGCEVSVPVVCTLLKRLLDIEYIGYFKMRDVLLEIIKQAGENKIHTIRTLKLTKLTLCDGLPLPDFGILCPNLQSLNFRMTEHYDDRFIVCLNTFPRILHLSLINDYFCVPTPRTYDNFSTTNALRLTSLTISYGTFELAYLLLLGERCPNLTELRVKGDYFLCDRNLKIEDNEASYKKLSVFIFKFNQIIKGYSGIMVDILCSVLKNTKILRRLALIGRDILTDESFRYLLSHINTDSLVDLNIGEVPLTMSSVHYVLDKCLHLRVLSGLYAWNVDRSDIEQLQKDLIASNYDIQLSGRFVQCTLTQ